MELLLCDELIKQGITKDDVVHVFKAQGKVMPKRCELSVEEFYVLLAEAYTSEEKRGRVVTTWRQWLGK